MTDYFEDIEWKEEVIKIAKPVVHSWVPENLSKFKKSMNIKKPCLYGLPMFQLYYTTPCQDHDGVYNRLNGSNNKLHAYRIIIGMTWNWLVLNNAMNMNLTYDDLNNSINVILYHAADRKMTANSEVSWNDLLHLSNDDYLELISSQQGMIEQCRNIQGMKNYITDYLCHIMIQPEALTQFVSLPVQKSFKEQYGSKAISEYKRTWFETLGWNARVDLTTDYIDWMVNKTDSELRHSCWLSGKQIQRLLTKTGKNSKSKHRRKS